MDLKKYYVITGVCAFIGSPIIASIGFIGIELIFPPILLLGLSWFFYVKKTVLPENASKIFLPIVAAYSYYMLIWILALGLSGYHFYGSSFLDVYPSATLPYFIINLMLDFGGDYYLFPMINSGVAIVTIVTIILSCKIFKKKIMFGKSILLYAFIFVLLSGIAFYQYYDRSAQVLNADYNVEQVTDEVNLYDYQPFSDDSQLIRSNEPAAISISDNYPKLDGATAVYPVYGAIAQEIYKGLNMYTANDYVSCTTTSEAYDRLINGDIDIFFGAQPSKQQLIAAEAKGVKLALTPIAKEAFVFFVNNDNPVDILTIEQIQSIYQKKITNWSELGGRNEKIMPFQRPQNSGSQTFMLAKVMGSKPLPPPLWEEYGDGVDGAISEVAAYRNYTSAIGYSFRYFATRAKLGDSIKLISINGIAPSIENIRNKIYPLTVDVYAVTAGSKNQNTNKLIQWIISEQGQDFIETCGYIPQ